MAVNTITPAASNADELAYNPGTIEDPRDYGTAEAKRVDGKYVLGPTADELMALVKADIADQSYLFQYTCLAGDAVGDPVYLQANDTVNQADATTTAKSKVIGFIRHKGTLKTASSGSATTCYLQHYLYVTGLSGGTFGDPVYLTDAGGFAATPGTIEKKVGTFLTASTAILKADGIDSQSIDSTTRICNGRLTLETGVAVSTSDQTAKTNIYFTPYKGNRVSLYTSSRWEISSFSEITLALGTLTDATNYDVFLYDNAGTLTLEAVAWTNDTTRATAITLQDGVYCKSGSLDRRYLGSFRTTSTTTTEASNAKRFVWNYYNRVAVRMHVIEDADTWAGATTSWAQVRAQSDNQLSFIIGVDEDVITARAVLSWTSTTVSAFAYMGIGLDSATPDTNCIRGWGQMPVSSHHLSLTSFWSGHTGIGYHDLIWTEYGGTNGTFEGDNAGTNIQSGIKGELFG